MVCVLDFKREVGLWHSMLASVFNGMHVVFIPYALMKVKTREKLHFEKNRGIFYGNVARFFSSNLNVQLKIQIFN
jgi:hypothetical protein